MPDASEPCVTQDAAADNGGVSPYRVVMPFLVLVGIVALGVKYRDLHGERRIAGRPRRVMSLLRPKGGASAVTGKPAAAVSASSAAPARPAPRADDEEARPAAGGTEARDQNRKGRRSVSTSGRGGTPATATKPANDAGHDDGVAAGSGTRPGSGERAGEKPKAATGASRSRPAAVNIDWSNREITGPVPRANMVIYLRQRCVLLRSHAAYVRVYRDIAVPSDISVAKSRAADKRAPVGTYYVRERGKDERGKYLLLDYPAPADARRALADGIIDRDTLARIQAARKAGRLPPQDTPLGGNVRVRAGRENLDATADGFALYAPQMEELWKAVKVGTPVIIVK